MFAKGRTHRGVSLVAFQGIASFSGGNRASGGPGYDRGADYVAALAKLAGYKVTRQPFEFNFREDTGSSFAQNAPTPTRSTTT